MEERERKGKSTLIPCAKRESGGKGDTCRERLPYIIASKKGGKGQAKREAIFLKKGGVNGNSTGQDHLLNGGAIHNQAKKNEGGEGFGRYDSEKLARGKKREGDAVWNEY